MHNLEQAALVPIAEEHTPSPLVEFTRNWWHGLLDDSARLTKWLKKLYQNEAEAEQRFITFANKWTELDQDAREVLHAIANQEANHGKLVAEVLSGMGQIPEVGAVDDRYWQHTIPHITNLQTAAAVGAFAEVTSLNRLRVLGSDAQSPKDLRQLFGIILPDETFHARALASIAGSEAMRKIRPYHELGLQALKVRSKNG